MLVLAPFWMLLACAPGDDTAAVDRDGDGALSADDCDDADPRRAPGYPEECDRLDNDCDDLVDEADPDLTEGATWFRDADGDGAGDGSGAATLCTRSDGYVSSAGDCDDTDPSVSAPTDWFRDDDGDGFGDASDGLSACGGPDGRVLDATDCDDTEPGVFPGAAEVCGDGLDQNCDGTPNDCGSSGESTLPGTSAVVTGDGALGTALADLGAPDGVPTFAAGAPGFGLGAGAVSVWSWGGGAFVTRALLSAESAIDGAGAHVAASDLDGDGVSDLLVAGARSAWLVHGPFDADRELASAEASFTPGSTIGALAPVGDHNGDGIGDLLLAAPDTDATVGYVLSGAAAGATALDGALATLVASRSFNASSAAGLGDIDGDGLPDAAIVNASGTETRSAQGIVYVLAGPVSGAVALPEVETRLLGEQAAAGTGMHVTAAGDLDADGYADILVGGPALDSGGTDAGGLWLVRGPVTTLVDLAAADWSVRGDTAYTGLGRAVTPLDIDGDGRLDLLVGGARDTSSRGDVRVFLAPDEGEALASEAHALLIGAEPGDNAGLALAPGGDPDADGDTEVLIGAPGASAVYVLVGGPGL